LDATASWDGESAYGPRRRTLYAVATPNSIALGREGSGAGGVFGECRHNSRAQPCAYVCDVTDRFRVARHTTGIDRSRTF